MPLRGQTVGVVVAVDLGTGQPLAIAHLAEHDPQAVVAWLRPLVARWGTAVLVTDDLQSYRGVAEQLRCEVQVCWWHVRRWAGRALRELAPLVGAEGAWAITAVEEVLAQTPRDGGVQLLEVWQAAPDRARRRGQQAPLERLRQLVLRLSNGWGQYQYYRDWPDVPATNNGTERLIGRIKQRTRTVRHYKSWGGLGAAAWVLAGGLS